MRRAFGGIAVLSLIALAGCASVDIERAVYVNGLDPRPRMDTEAALRGQIGALSPSDAVVVARGNARQVVAPQPVTLRLVERLMANGGAGAGGEGNETSANQPRIVALKYILGENGRWGQSRTVLLNENPSGQFEARFRLFVINVGRGDFDGEIDVRDRLPQGLTPSSGMTVRRIVDNRDARAALSMIPYIGLIALAVDDFSLEDPIPAPVALSGDGTISLRLPATHLAPGEGIMLEFAAIVPRPQPL
jgi:hypothetical protein